MKDSIGTIDLVLPTVPHLLAQVTAATAAWPARPRILVDTAEEGLPADGPRGACPGPGLYAFELALAGVPLVAAYKVSRIEAPVLRLLLRTRSFILANLVLGERVVPQLMQRDCTAERLAAALLPLIRDTPERRRQIRGVCRARPASWGIGIERPAMRAADIVIAAKLRRPAAAFAGNTVTR